VASTVYGHGSSYGFEPGSTVSCVDRGGSDALHSDLCTSDGAFLFSLDVPEGNYRVSITLAIRRRVDHDGEAESRRLMLERIHTGKGSFETRHFTVNVRNSRIASGGLVQLKDREQGAFHWMTS